MNNTHSLASAVIEAKQALADATAAKNKAEALLKEAYAKAGITFEVVDGTKVSVVNSHTTSYDLEALAGMVSPKIFKMVTKPAIDTDKWEAAVTTGQIKPEVASAVATKKPHTKVLLHELNKATEAGNNTTAKVA